MWHGVPGNISGTYLLLKQMNLANYYKSIYLFVLFRYLDLLVLSVFEVIAEFQIFFSWTNIYITHLE